MAQSGNHSDRDHALLSPSAAHRWGKCEGSLLFEDTRPPGEAARLGTLAHEVLEAKLVQTFDGEIPEDLPEEYVEATNDAYTYIMDNLVADEDATMYVEEQLKYSDILWGTADVVIDKGDKLIVMDFKTTRSHVVQAENNPQLTIYAFMALMFFQDMVPARFKTIEMHIVQPLRDNYACWTIDREELLKAMSPYAALASRIKYNGVSDVRSAGEHCQWCPGAAECREFREHVENESLAVITTIDAPTKEDVKALARNLSTEEQLQIFEKRELIKTLLAETEASLMLKAKAEKLPGVKLVKGRATRKWIDDEGTVLTGLKQLGIKQPYNTKLKGITEVEKELGKGKIGELTHTPEPKLLLVEDSDKREAVDTEQEVLDCITEIGE